jgi:EmrB/QacA subfamily drug resistance transporter
LSSAAVVPADVPELTRQQKIFTLAGVMVAMFLAALDQNVVGTAGPAIQESLRIPNALYVWITTAYMVGGTVLVPVYGKLSDLFGRKRIILSGVTIFLIASALCGVSQNSGQLIAFRALQGIGSASLFTTAFAVIADLFPPSERGKYSGMFGAVFGLASLVGPLLGGFITDNFGWHWVFFINLPIGAVALFFIITRMPPLRRALATPPRVDVLGAVMLALGVIPLLLALSFGRSQLRAGEAGYLWGSWQIFAMLGAALTFSTAFVLVERTAAEPLVDLTLFKDKVFAVGNATIFVNGAAFMAPLIFLPLYMVKVVGVTNTASGLTISPLVMGIVAGNVVSGQLVSRFGKYKPLMLGSLLLLMIGFAVMAFTLRPDSTQAEVTLKMILVGLGLGPAIPLYTIAVQNAVRPEQMGVATSIGTFSRQMGATIGIAVAGTLFANTLQNGMATYGAEATANLPPQLKAQFQKLQGGEAGAEGGGPADGKLDPARIKASIAERFEGSRVMVVKALKGDAAAAMAVKASGLADPRIERMISDGGPRAQVRVKFDALGRQVAVSADDAQLWAALVKVMPPPMRPDLEKAEPWKLAAPERAQFVATTQAELRAQAETFGDEAEAHAIAGVEAGLANAKTQSFASVDALALALKRAFTDSMVAVYKVALALAALAFLLTVFLPQVPLRKTIGRGPPPVAE